MTSFFQHLPADGCVCAHRGVRSLAPENTLLALVKARECGAALWETDVQLTEDGQGVLFHDRTLARTTNVAELSTLSDFAPWALVDLCLENVRQLDAGSWFLRDDPFATVASGLVTCADYPVIRQQKVPLLDEALEYTRRHRFPVNLELKDQSGTSADRKLVSVVLAAIARYGVADLVLISSFNHDYLRQVKALNPLLATAALVEELHPENLLAYLRELDVAAYHPDQKIADTGLIRELTAAGIRVNLWTVNDIDQARGFAAAGAGFICTDWPQRMVGRL